MLPPGEAFDVPSSNLQNKKPQHRHGAAAIFVVSGGTQAPALQY